MRTREESLNNFCRALDGLIASKYLFANSGVFDVITIINSSKLLSDLFKYFTDGFDFYDTLSRCATEENGVKTFTLPARNTDVMAFVYSLLREINYNRFQLSDLLDYMGAGKNYEAAYKNFCQIVLLPFRSYTYQVGMQVINSVQVPGESLAQNEGKDDFQPESMPTESVPEQQFIERNEAPTNVLNETVINEQSDISKRNDVSVENEVQGNLSDSNDAERHNQTQAHTHKIVFQRTIYRLLELDRLAITQSHSSHEDKEDLLYVLDIFNDKLYEGDKEKITLAYLAYYHALRPYKKIKSNLKGITDILLEMGILG